MDDLGVNLFYNTPSSFIEIIKLYDPEKLIDSSNNKQNHQQQTHVFNGNPII